MTALTSSRLFVDPLGWLKRHSLSDFDHITMDPNLRSRDADYRIIRGCLFDGTAVFADETIARALAPLVMRASYDRKHPPSVEQRSGMRYVLGLMRIASVHGLVDLPAGRYPGERMRVCVPVRCILPS